MDKILENMKTGFFKAKILAINPNSEELSELLEEESEAPEYTYERKGVKTTLVDIYLSSINDELFKHSIYCDEKEIESKNSGAKLFLNSINQQQWSNNTNNLWNSFIYVEDKKWSDVDKKYEILGKLGDRDYHIAQTGEPSILSLIQATSSLDPKDTNTSYFIDFQALAEGDLSELKELIPIGENCLTAFAYITKEEEQKIFKDVLSLNMFQDMAMNIPSKFTKSKFDNWHKSFDFIKSDVIYNFGKLQNIKEEFLPKSKDINPEEADY